MCVFKSLDITPLKHKIQKPCHTITCSLYCIVGGVLDGLLSVLSAFPFQPAAGGVWPPNSIQNGRQLLQLAWLEKKWQSRPQALIIVPFSLNDLNAGLALHIYSVLLFPEQFIAGAVTAVLTSVDPFFSELLFIIIIFLNHLNYSWPTMTCCLGSPLWTSTATNQRLLADWYFKLKQFSHQSKKIPFKTSNWLISIKHCS